MSSYSQEIICLFGNGLINNNESVRARRKNEQKMLKKTFNMEMKVKRTGGNPTCRREERGEETCRRE
jgi:hypothetical protein